jgi:hypothetical protein
MRSYGDRGGPQGPGQRQGVTSVPRTVHREAPAPTPYDERPEWTELWEACVALLDRYPHIRPTAPMWPPVLRHVHIPPSAVDAADRHYHLD